MKTAAFIFGVLFLWSWQPASAQIMCLGLSDPANGTISFSQGVMVGSMATYTCHYPFILSENNNQTCEASAVGAVWSGSQPTCTFPDFNNATIRFERSNYTVMENGSVEVCIAVYSGFVGSPFNIWYHRRFFGITIWFHITLPYGLVTGDIACSDLSVANDDLLGNNMTITVPLEIPENVTGVTAESNTTFSLFFIDNDGPDVDECAMGIDNCDSNAECMNTDGSFNCTCNPGYTGDGLLCSDIDECATNTDNCNENALCTDVEGSFECVCNTGFNGDGVSCAIPATVDAVSFYFNYYDVYVYFYLSNLVENPFLNNGDFNRQFDRTSDVPCFLNELVFRNTNTNETFQADYPGFCSSYSNNFIFIRMNHRDYLKLVLDGFISTTSTTPLEMYTADMLGAPFNLHIEPNDAIEFNVIMNFYSYVGITDLDYWIDEGILLIHFRTLIDVATVNPSKLSLFRNYDRSNAVSITGGEVLNQSPGLARSVAIRLTSDDLDILACRGICTGNDLIFNQACYLGVESEFATGYFGVEVSPTTGYRVNNIRRAPTDFEPVTMSIQLEYIDGLIFNLTLGLGQPFTVRYDVGERIISVMCTSRNTSHMNPMLDIDNGAVSIPPNYIQNDWPNSTTLNAPWGLAESGLQGYHTCRTEGDTFLSHMHHLLHPNGNYIFFYNDTSISVDIYEDIVLRFAHSGNFEFNWFQLFTNEYNRAPFNFRFEINTPFPYHAELHIARTRFNYAGEYFIYYNSHLWPNIIIDVNALKLTLYPPVLTVLSSDPPDTTASLTCTSSNSNVPVMFPGNHTSLGITSTYLDDTKTSVRLDFELNESLIGMLEGMKFICEARDPDNFNSIVSTASSTFRKVSAPLSIYAIEPDSSRNQVMDGAMINTASSFECLWYINSTQTDIEVITETLFWRINLESQEEMEFTSDVSVEDYIVTTLENGITLNILGSFRGNVSCIYGNDSLRVNVVTRAPVSGVDFIPPIFPEDAVELFDSDDGCSQRIYSSTGIPFGAATHQYVHVCTNGMLTVGTPPLFLGTASERFPTSDIRISQSNLLAPFWNDHDNRDFTSSVRYRVYNDAGGDTDSFINIVSSFISNRIDAEIFGTFVPTWMLVASWRDVPPYPYTAIDRGKNSFEAIIITDGVVTFAVYTYNCDDLQWGQSQDGDYSTIGYNINPASFFGSDPQNLSAFQDHRISNLPMSEMVACSSLVRGSRYHNEVYLVGQSRDTTQLARAECTSSINNDTLYGNIIIRSTVRDGCPCNLAQASRDFAFSFIGVFQLTLDPVYADQFCYTPRFSQINTILCCYSQNSGALNNVGGISGVVAYSPSFFPREFLDNDYNLRRKCSIGGAIDTLYRTRRPPVTCAIYQPPRRTFCSGDPHLTNLDGTKFTFNGWGEYILLELETDNTTFWVQARMHPLVDSNATELGGFAFAMSRDTPVEIRLNATRQLDILISGEDVTDQLVNVSSSISTDFYSVSRSSSNSILATFPNGMGLMVTLSSMLTFTVIIPDAFRGLTRGMVGNYNGDVTDDVRFRNGTLVPLSEFSFRILHQVGLSWQLDASESLFTYPEGLTAADFAVLDHDPPYLDEVVASASAEVLQACGNNVECIFDSMETGDINIGLETMAMISIIDEDERLASNFPPMINGPDTLYVTLGEQAELVFNVTDDKGIINVTLVDGLPAGATLLPAPIDNFTVEYTLKLQLDTIFDISLVFLATDELDSGSTLEVQVVICACVNNGNCTLEGVVDQSASTVVSNCLCPQGWEGDFCEDDVDGCANFDCFMSVNCVDVPAPGVGAMCGPCPQGYRGDGSKCADINECNGTHGCAQLCVNEPGSFECACYPGYELVSQAECRDINECSLLNGGCHHFCNNTIGGFDCSCEEGYTISIDNETCQVDPISMCDAMSSCAQSCVSLSGVETCNCLPGFELASNQIDCTNINECLEDPCEQICVDLAGGYECSCREGYELLPGGRCTDINECLVAAMDISTPDLCGPLMFCVNGDGNYSCECLAGTLLMDGVCEAVMCLDLIDPANGTISFSQGVMVGSVATYTCNDPYILSENSNPICEPSAVGAMWSGSQPTCNFPDFNSVTISFERSDYTVIENGSVEVCIAVDSGFVGSPFNIWYHENLFGITIWFHITLPYGLVTGDTECSDLSVTNDDLLGNNMTITVPLEIPENVTGVTAESNTTFSLLFIDNDGPDVDECAMGIDNCDSNAECMNTEGSFNCTCNPGYTGDGLLCNDIDECATNTNSCNANTVCTNGEGSFECMCDTGFSGDGVSCANIDECASLHNCHDNALCTDTMGSFNCVCDDGYRGDGVACIDIDECDDNMDNCTEDNAECTNTIGSFTCACDPGYSGDGTVCTDTDECAAGLDNCHPNATCSNSVGSFSCDCYDDFFGDGNICIPGVQLSLAPDRYSVLEGESLDVTMNVYNPSDENITVSGCFHILKIELYVSYSFDVHAGAMFAQTETIMFPGDDILNDMEKMNVELVLESDSDLVTIVDGYGTANVIVVDDDIVDVGFTETEVYVLESEGVVHVCVELLQGSGCQRPLVLRVNTRKHSDATFPANKSDDFKTLREVGSININAEEGQTECFDVNIVNDDYYEQNETFKIMLDVKDANVFTLVDMVIVTIIDDDIAPIFCPELSIENGEVTVMGEQTPGTTAHYSCDEFYILNGNTYRTCQENGTWTGEDPECERGPFTASCLSSMDSITGPLIINCSTVGPAVIVNISCDFDNSARVEECTSLLSINFLDFDAGIHTLVITFTDADGIAVQSSFSFSVPFVCPSLSIGNGDVDIMGRMFKIGYLAGAIANYSCDNFFILAGNEFRNCQADGTWDGMDPECERGPIMLDCTSSQTSPAVLPDLSCTAVGPFSIVNTICNFDDGAYNITECDLAAPLKSPVVGQLGAGNHTLLITVSDSDGEMAKFIFNFFIPPPLGLACVEVEFNPFLYRLMCTADNSLSKPLLCEAASSLGSFTVDCGQLDVVNTIDAPPLLGDVAYTLTVSAVDIFEQQESDVLMFILPGPPTLELQFNNNTPDVDGSDIRVSFVSNNPLESAVCAINGPNPISRSCDLAMDGFSGSFVFSPVNRVTARYITITAMSANSQTGSLIRGVRSGAIAQCSAHLINEGVVISGNSVTVEFTITGLANLASSICILGSQVVDPCTSPVTFDNVIQAEFQGGLVIRPNDPDRLCSRTISRLVTLV
ncbi:uncharacterized protein LOC135334155 isoform X9 [Halichondria panicea]|uniref:uncharacterized protein LOC135334155 isoform X9 n=1 Tax=Halichondria panicea TaxID=6063 RepID=UPI00312B5203